MTVKQISFTHDYQGLSTDDKPLTAPPDGATYHAIDTGEMWVYHDGMWLKDLRLQKAFEAII